VSGDGLETTTSTTSIFSFPHVISTVEVFNAKHNSRVEMLYRKAYTWPELIAVFYFVSIL
jgi:hypothetical protein